MHHFALKEKNKEMKISSHLFLSWYYRVTNYAWIKEKGIIKWKSRIQETTEQSF